MAASDEPSVGHADAIYQLLVDAFTSQQYPVYKGESPDEPAYPHVVVWSSPGLRPSYVMRGYGGEITTRTQITCVGLTTDDATGMADRVSGALHRVRPVIEGRKCGDIEQDQETIPPPPLLDPRLLLVGRTVYFVPLFFGLQSSAILHP